MASPSASQYVAQHEEALQRFLALENDKDWKFNKEEDGVKFYFRSEAGSSYTQVKSVTDVAAPVEAVTAILDTIKTVEPSKPEDGFKERREFGQLNDENKTSFLYVVVQSGSRLVTDRDFIMLRRKYVKDGKTIYLHVSVPDEVQAVNKSYVRGQMKLQGYIVEADPANAGHCKLTFMVHTDPAGSIPAMVYNAVVGKQGLVVKKIRDQAQSK